MNKYLDLIALAVLVCVGILLNVSSITVPDGIDKVGHFAGFAAVTLLSVKVMAGFLGTKYINFYLFIISAFGGPVAALSELVQKYIPVRSCSFEDWAINIAGIYIPVLIIYFIYNRQVKKAEAL